MRDRKPKPSSMHKLQGTLNTTRHKARTVEPRADGDLPEAPPSWMSASQKAGWRYAVRHAPKGIMRRIDRGMLAVWVVAAAASLVAADYLTIVVAVFGTTISPYLFFWQRPGGGERTRAAGGAAAQERTGAAIARSLRTPGRGPIARVR